MHLMMVFIILGVWFLVWLHETLRGLARRPSKAEIERRQKEKEERERRYYENVREQVRKEMEEKERRKQLQQSMKRRR